MAGLCNSQYHNSCTSKTHFHLLLLNCKDMSQHTSCSINTILLHMLCNFMAGLRNFYILNCKAGNSSSSRKCLLDTTQYIPCQCNTFLKENNMYNIRTGTIWRHHCCKLCSKTSWYKCCILFDKDHKFVPNCFCSILQDRR